MNRRDITRGLGAAAVLGGLPLASLAQGGPVEGRDFQKLDKPLPVSPGKVEVVEFFGYWCPHCNTFEPVLDAWVRKLPPAQVGFRRVAVAFNAAQEPIQRLYYALEALGLIDAMHVKVFTAIHASKTLSGAPKEDEIARFLTAHGADAAKVVDTMKGFAVATKVRQARQLAEGYGLDGVPLLGIHGRWRTSPSIAGGHERALAVADVLIAQARKG
jgi:protein dithiol oxidoreductase (disulfide-forming)